MKCQHCFLELFPVPEMVGEDHAVEWIDKEWGEATCYDAATGTHPMTQAHKPEATPSYTIDCFVDEEGQRMMFRGQCGNCARRFYQGDLITMVETKLFHHLMENCAGPR